MFPENYVSPPELINKLTLKSQQYFKVGRLSLINLQCYF